MKEICLDISTTLLNETNSQLEITAPKDILDSALKLILEQQVSPLGCTDRCPFCGSLCDCAIGNHTEGEGSKSDHRATHHWPTGANKYSWDETKKLVIDICTTLVASDCKFTNSITKGEWHPYKEYRKYYPNWHIPPDVSYQASAYWKWFISKYGAKLAELYKLEPPDVPWHWSKISWKEAVESIENTYNISLWKQEETIDEKATCAIQ